MNATPDQRSIFHLSFPVADLAATLSFYAECLGAGIGRFHGNWADIVFFGHQITVHGLPDQVAPRAARGVRHFGAILGWEAWQRVRDRAVAYDTAFAAGVSFREVGTPREHAKLLLEDPDGNLIELKAYRDVRSISGALGAAE